MSPHIIKHTLTTFPKTTDCQPDITDFFHPPTHTHTIQFLFKERSQCFHSFMPSGTLRDQSLTPHCESTMENHDSEIITIFQLCINTDTGKGTPLLTSFYN